MNEESGFFDDYNFYGSDDAGMTSNDMEIMKYLFGDEPLAPPIAIKWTPPPNGERQSSFADNNGHSNDIFKKLVESYRATPEHTQSDDEARIHIIEACKASRNMTIWEFVALYNPTGFGSKSHILLGIQSAETILGLVDIDWAITLAGFSYMISPMGLTPTIGLYETGKMTWNLARKQKLNYNINGKAENKAILMADMMVLFKMKFHKFFPWYTE